MNARAFGKFVAGHVSRMIETDLPEILEEESNALALLKERDNGGESVVIRIKLNIGTCVLGETDFNSVLSEPLQGEMIIESGCLDLDS